MHFAAFCADRELKTITEADQVGRLNGALEMMTLQMFNKKIEETPSSKQVYKIAELLSSRSIFIDVKNSLSETDSVEFRENSLDIDSLIISYARNKSSLNGINSPSELVSFAFKNKWICDEERHLSLIIDDTKYIGKNPTMGIPKGTKHILPLLVPLHNDPIKGWVIFNNDANIKTFMSMVREIACEILLLEKPAAHYFNIAHIKQKEKKNKGKTLWGMWSNRLAVIWYQILFPDEEIIYIEESYNFKNRALHINPVLNPFSEETIEINAGNYDREIVRKIVSNTSGMEHSMLSFMTLGVLKPTIIIGIGFQTEAFDKVSGKILYPCVDQTLSNSSEMANRLSVSRKAYNHFGLARGIGGFTEKVNDVCLLFTNNNPNPVPVRNQIYYNAARYAFGEGLEAYSDKVSTKLQICRISELNNMLALHENDFNPNLLTLTNNLSMFKTLAEKNKQMFMQRSGFRQEMAFLCSDVLVDINGSKKEQSISIIDDESCNRCSVCFKKSAENLLIQCAICQDFVHFSCTHLKKRPKVLQPFHCYGCFQNLCCELCGQNSGYRNTDHAGIVTHPICVEWIPELDKKTEIYVKDERYVGKFNTLSEAGLNKIDASRLDLQCCICNKKKYKGCIQCESKLCYTAFHPYCVLHDNTVSQSKKAVLMRKKTYRFDAIERMCYCAKHENEYEWEYMENSKTNLKPLRKPSTLSQKLYTPAPLWDEKYATLRKSKMEKRLTWYLLTPIKKSLTLCYQNMRFIDIQTIAEYSFSILNAYIYFYELGLVTLRKKLSLAERQTLTLFLKFIQDYFALFYSGCTKRQQLGESLYEYSVHLHRRGLALNRPFNMFPVLPGVLLRHLNELLGGMPIPNIMQRGFVLTQPHHTRETEKRYSKYKRMLIMGHPAHEIIQCHGCRKYFLTLMLLFDHLGNAFENRLDECRSKYDAKKTGLTQLSREVAVTLNNEFENMCTSFETQRALSLTREGKSVYISGDPGTGKSYLCRILMMQLFLIHGDIGAVKKYVFGIAGQGIACANMNTHYRTIHKFLGISEPIIPIFDSDVMLQSYCKSYLDTNPETWEKLRLMEVLMIDEIGSIHASEGILLHMMLKLARGSDLAFGGVQIICSGQVTQMLPLPSVKTSSYTQSTEKVPSYARESFGTDSEINDVCIKVHLCQFMRSQADKVLQDLISKCKESSINADDVKILTSAGENVRKLLHSHRVLDNVQVTALYFEHKNRRTANHTMIKACIQKCTRFENDNWDVKGTFGQVFSEDEISLNRESSSFQLFEPIRMHNCSEEFTRWPDPNPNIYDKVPYISDPYEMDNNPDCFVESLKMEHCLYLFKGVPLILNRNMDVSPVQHEKLQFFLANGSQGVFEAYVYHDKSPNEKGKHKIVTNKWLGHGDTVKRLVAIRVKMRVTSDSGKDLEYIFEFFRTKSSFNMKSADIFHCKYHPAVKGEKGEEQVGRVRVIRSQFPFKYGLAVSWSAIQGLTIPYIFLDFNKNQIVIDKYPEHPAMWLVALSRVKSLDNILINLPSKYEIEEVLKFLNCMDTYSIQFERNWIKDAQQTQSEYVLKAEHGSALLDQMIDDFNSAQSELTLAYKMKELRSIIVTLLNAISLSHPSNNRSDFIKNIYSGQLKYALEKGKELISEFGTNPLTLTLKESFLFYADVCEKIFPNMKFSNVTDNVFSSANLNDVLTHGRNEGYIVEESVTIGHKRRYTEAELDEISKELFEMSQIEVAK